MSRAAAAEAPALAVAVDKAEQAVEALQKT